MSDDRLALQILLEKTSSADFLREMIGFAPSGRRPLGARRSAGRPRRAQCRAPRSAQRRSGSGPGDRASAVDLGPPKLQARQRLPFLAEAPAHRGENADRGDPGGACARHLDPLGGRAGQSHGHDRHHQEPGLAPGDRRAGAGCPRSGRSRRDRPYLRVDATSIKVRHAARYVAARRRVRVRHQVTSTTSRASVTIIRPMPSRTNSLSHHTSWRHQRRTVGHM